MRILGYLSLTATIFVLFATFSCEKEDRSVRARKWRHMYYHSVTTYDSLNQVISQTIDTSSNDEIFGVTGLGSPMVIAKDKTFENKFAFADRIEYSYNMGHGISGALHYYPALDSLYFRDGYSYGPAPTSVPSAPYKAEVGKDAYWTY